MLLPLDSSDLNNIYWCEIGNNYSKLYEMVYEDETGHEQAINVCNLCGSDTEEFHTKLIEDDDD
jgi:hypothetical protein